MTTTDKPALRERLLAARRLVTDDVRTREARALGEHLGSVAPSGSTVCAYVPTATEPGSIEMLELLLRRAGRVLVPVARTADDGTAMPLRWGEYRPGRLVPGRFGLLEPPEPWLPAPALAQAAMVLVPALAVDRRGVRLGHGRGFYDRSLVYRDPRALVVAVVRDEEFVEELPFEPHDVRVNQVLTPARGMVPVDTHRE
ncbi:5-formyltetrahydrofolate cyclo-ligase [Mycobacterium sp. SM1]|uniref:5-formyltetrahydrofolate cyclo-ligase n=1 Tax=Mycobacterium sp. SM1 TaxID=2816243 RepID=UPI001BCEDEBC|nr:5-formyltetrahydrofolate cyclo-ligase [Mycobacterium sp. SM1]MBS4729156.1 5-formyltetrahydrofolate cyclo-ligase [Mycobacterium sp. SM1]